MLLGMVEYWMISHDLCLLRRDDIVVEKGCVIFSGWKKENPKGNAFGQLPPLPALSGAAVHSFGA